MLIITSPLNSPETLALLEQLSNHNHTKVLIVDIVGAIFNKQNEFYRNIAKNRDRWLVNNLLVLTTLTEKLKRFLNATFTTEYNNIYGGPVSGSAEGNVGSETSSSLSTTTTVVSQNEDFSVLTTLSDFKTISLSTESPIHSISSTAKTLNNDQHFTNFNEIQLRTIFSLFRTNFFSENCSNIVDTISKKNQSTTATAVTIDDENALQKCIQDSESLAKCESYLRSTTKLFPRFDRSNVKVSCKKIANQIVKDVIGHKMLPSADAKNLTVNSTQQEFIHLIPGHNDTKFIDYFSFFDFIVEKLIRLTNENRNSTILNQTSASINSSTLDFCVLDFHVSRYSINGTAMATAFVWRPFLILRQSEIHQNIYDTHPLLVDHRNWFFDRGSRFWTCGLLCWILAGIVLLLLICILVAGVTVGLAVR